MFRPLSACVHMARRYMSVPLSVGGLIMFRRIVPVFCLFLLLAPLTAQAQDASELVVRLSEMEQRVRQMTGEIERLQYENQQLKDQLRALGAGGQTQAVPPVKAVPAEGQPGEPLPPAVLPGDAPVNAPPASETKPSRNDAFDPALDPDAPGAPKPLGTATPSRPLTEAERKQDQTGYRMPSGALPEDKPAAATRAPAPTGPSVAAAGNGDPRVDYEEAHTQYSQGNYHGAEMGFRKFLQSHPRDAKVPEAMYWLGETYLATNRPREAGEQFLALSKNYASSPKVPAALLKLGSSLVNLGAPDRACAIFSEVLRKYPKASQSYKDEVVREQRRAKCS